MSRNEKTFLVYCEKTATVVSERLAVAEIPHVFEPNDEHEMHNPHFGTFVVRDVSAVNLKSILKTCNALFLAKDF